MTKSPRYNKAAVDKELKKAGVKKGASKLTHKIMKGRQKTDEADGVSDADRNPSIERSKYKSTTTRKPDAKAKDKAQQARDKQKGLPMDDMSIAKRKKEREMMFNSADQNGKKVKYGVFSKGGSIGSSPEHTRKPVSTHDSKEEAQTKAKRMRKNLSPGEKQHYGISYVVKPIKESKINEGVLDDMDDDGFMAKRQLYDLAKYSVELHRMIQDTDNLEPWIQAKITKAADYIDTVKHYLEYQNIDGADDMADEVGFDDIGDIESSIEADIAPSYEQTEEVMEFEDEGETLTGDDILRMMFNRRIISLDTYNNPSVELYNAADWFASDLGPLDEIGSSDVSIWMRELTRELSHSGIILDGDKAHLYESEVKARSIYKKMLSGLKGKK